MGGAKFTSSIYILCGVRNATPHSPPANTGHFCPLTPFLRRKARPTSKECPWGLGERHVHRYMRSSRRAGSGPRVTNLRHLTHTEHTRGRPGTPSPVGRPPHPERFRE